MWGAPKGLIPSPPREKQLAKGPTEHAPAGRSVAGQMVKNNRAQRRSNVPHAPRPQRSSEPSYNALDSPYKTQGQFDQAVARTTQAGYQPELDSLHQEQEGEMGLHEAREGSNASIYEKYSAQAREAFDRAKSALAEIASRQNSSTQAGQQALQAALSNTGVSGLPGAANPNNFMAEAAGFGNQSSQTLAGTQAGEVAERAGDLNVPGAWRSEAQASENQRDQGKLNEIGLQRSKVLANIPAAQAKVRGELSSQEQQRQTNKLQAQIAQGKLGLEGKEGLRKRAGEKEQVGQKREEAHQNAILKTQELAQASGFKVEELKVEREKIAASVKNAKTGEQKAAAELAGKRFDHGLELMANYLKKNDKTEFSPTGVPAQDEQLGEGGKKQAYQRNAQQLYNQLTKQGNLTAPEAFRLMSSSGNGYVEQFAREHEAIYRQAEATRRKAGGPLKTLPPVPKKGQPLPTLRSPLH